MALLEVRQLHIAYDRRPVVEDVSFAVEPGEILGVAGESGSGKSTILRAVLGLLPPGGAVTGGTMAFDGTALTTERQWRALRGRRMGMVFQNSGASLCPVRTVEAQVRQVLGRGVSRREVERLALPLMEQLGLPEGVRVLRSYPMELSGGMCQRVGLLLAMLLEPELLLCDEPTSALDVLVQREVMETLGRLRRDRGTAMVLVTHNLALLESVADRVLILKDGRTVEQGSAAQVLTAPQTDYTRRLLAAVPRLRRSL